ncbi:hypothetical protein [Roseibium sp.]|uniref:hypothetical protein n=1 Tax=Roseibium sp. TaxID=1936156 RepID=UPI001B00B98B|nr:hypothetical protein [Roseibium sp.]MBO6856041.1 hypothetical protein [Roseibium sp.]
MCFRDYFAANSIYLLPPWQGGTIGSVRAPNGAAFKGGDGSVFHSGSLDVRRWKAVVPGSETGQLSFRKIDNTTSHKNVLRCLITVKTDITQIFYDAILVFVCISEACLLAGTSDTNRPGME